MNSGVSGFEGSGGPGEVVISDCLELRKKILTGFYVSYGPHWAAQGGPAPGPPASSPLKTVSVMSLRLQTRKNMCIVLVSL